MKGEIAQNPARYVTFSPGIDQCSKNIHPIRQHPTKALKTRLRSSFTRLTIISIL